MLLKNGPVASFKSADHFFFISTVEPPDYTTVATGS